MRSCVPSLKPGTRSLTQKGRKTLSFKVVNESMKTFAQRAGRWQNDTLVDFKMAHNHFFGKKAAAKS